MSLADINPSLPRYMQWTLFRDFHYTVFNDRDMPVLVLVTKKGELKSYWSERFNPKTENVVFENHELQARIMAGYYITECKDLKDLLREYFDEGEYKLAVVNASGKRLYNFSLYNEKFNHVD